MRVFLSSAIIGVSLSLALPAAIFPSAAAADSRFPPIPGVRNVSGYDPTARHTGKTVKVIIGVAGDPVARHTVNNEARGLRPDRTAARKRLLESQQPVVDLIKRSRGRVLHTYTESYSGIAAEVPTAVLTEIADAPQVTGIHPVDIVRVENAATADYVGARRVWQELGRTGAGVRIAVIDTGVDYTHVAFGGHGDPALYASNDRDVVEPGTFPTKKVVGGRDFVGDQYDPSSPNTEHHVPKPDADPLDCHGHGTHVAAIAAGSAASHGETAVAAGMAPDAEILAYKTFGCAGTATTDVILAAMDQAARDGADIVNLSLGFPLASADSPFRTAVENLTRSGITVVAAAGNHGSAAYVTSAPGVADTAISVAAADASAVSETAAVSDFTSAGPRVGDSAVKPDITAPGTNIASAAVGTGTGTTLKSGTSMAAPVIAGIAALIAEAHPEWTPGQIKAAIVSTADGADRLSGYSPARAGSGMVNAHRAVETTVLARAPRDGGNLSFGFRQISGHYDQGQLPLTIENTGASPVIYHLSASFIGDSLGAKVEIWPNTLWIGPGKSAKATVALSFDTRAIAALPAAHTSIWGALTTVRGVVTATPRQPSPGVVPLRVAFVSVPTATSDITATAAIDRGSDGRSATLSVRNRGVRAGAAGVLSWSLADGADCPADPSVDIRSVGVDVRAGTLLGGAPQDRSLIFAINVHGRWSNPSTGIFRIFIDGDSDGVPDHVIVAADYTRVTTGHPGGYFAALAMTSAGEVTGAFVAEAPMNGSTMLLPVLASHIGLSEKLSRFTYWVSGESLNVTGAQDLTGTATLDILRPPTSSDWISEIRPWETVTSTSVIDPAEVAATSTRGWLIVSHDDRHGPSEAEEIAFP